MHIPYGEGDAHKSRLERGLTALGPFFIAKVCWWCEGTTERNFQGCEVCGKNGYGTATGLLIGNAPAPDSVVNQVLVAAGAE